MNKLRTLFCLLLLVFLVGCTRTNEATPDDSGFFVKLFGGAKNENAYQILPLPEGGYVGVGSTESYSTEGLSDIFFFLIDKNGNVTKQIGIGGAVGRSVKPTADGGFITLGDERTPNDVINAYIVKTDKMGVVQWKKSYRPAEIDVASVVKGISIENSPDGGYWVLGSIELPTKSSLYITKISGTGTVLRERTYGFENTTNVITAIAQNAVGDIAVAGTVTNTSPTNPKDMRVVLTNNLANLKWDYAFNKNPEDVGVDLKLIPNGYVLLGTTIANGNSDIIVNRLNEVGEATLSVTVGGEGNQIARSVAPTQDGGFIVVGDIEKTGNGSTIQTDIYVAKLDYFGNVEWTKTFGSSEPDNASVVCQDADGNYTILATIGFVTTKMCGVIRLNSKGEFLK